MWMKREFSMKAKTAGYLPLSLYFFPIGAGVLKLLQQAEAPKPPEATPKFVPDPNAEKYKLVFATDYLWRGNYTAADEEEHNRAINSFRANWKERMNEAGAQRYRIISVVNGITLAKIDKMQYDYALLYTSSNVFSPNVVLK